MKIKFQTLSSELNPCILHAVIGGEKSILHNGSHRRWSVLRSGLPFLQFRFWKRWNSDYNLQSLTVFVLLVAEPSVFLLDRPFTQWRLHIHHSLSQSVEIIITLTSAACCGVTNLHSSAPSLYNHSIIILLLPAHSFFPAHNVIRGGDNGPAGLARPHCDCSRPSEVKC